MTPARVSLVEVGPRDGLQNETATLTTGDKVRFVDALTAAGLERIEVSAFVSPRRVPQMADAAEVFSAISRKEGVRYSALVPNLAGLERALSAHVTEIAMFASASETFSVKNVNQTIAQSLDRYAELAKEAAASGLPVRGYVSCAFGCPFEGEVAVAAVADVTRALLDCGAYEVAISDTIGVAHPGQVRRLMTALMTAGLPMSGLALHLHDTRGTALANVLAALDLGVTTFDASAGGLGGCPFAPGASGNLATEDLLYMLDGLGIATGVSRSRVSEASAALAPLLTHPLRARSLSGPSATPR